MTKAGMARTMRPHACLSLEGARMRELRRRPRVSKFTKGIVEFSLSPALS